MKKHTILLAVAILFHIVAVGQQLEKPSILNSHFLSNNISELKYNLQSLQTASQKLDSIVSFTQDEDSGEWNQKTLKRTFYYDSNFNDTLIVYSGWDSIANKWEFRAKVTRKYNEQNNTLTQECTVLDRVKYRTEYTFNDEKRLIQTIESRWDFTNDDWIYIDKNRYNYNSEGLLQSDSLYKMYAFSGSEMWKLVGKTFFTYNIDNKLSADTTYVQNWEENTSSGWQFHNNTQNFYSPENKIDEYILSSWSSDSVKFIPYKREIKQYFDDGETIKKTIDFSWDKLNSKWEADEHKENTLENNFITKCNTQTFAESPTVYSQGFVCDFNVNRDQLVLPTNGLDNNEQTVFHHLIKFKYHLKGETEIAEWERYLKTEYFYSDIETSGSLNPDLKKKIEIYPNPASYFITINGVESFKDALFELFNDNGKLVLSRNIYSNESLNISSLNKGLYIYKVSNGQETITGKLIKR